MKLLHVDSSITGSQSVSRRITASIVAHLKLKAPDLVVTYRDIAARPIPHLSEVLFVAKATGNASGEIQHDLAVTEAALDEFLTADTVVLGAPMYNFGIPSQLKTWIDSLAIAGKTFRYSENGPEGLCGGKRVIIASARGGIYTPPSPMASLDHQETYLRSLFGFIGISDIAVVRAEGVAIGPEQRQQALEAALAAVAAL
jgi:FMN-dependent NADH-azoreductase